MTESVWMHLTISAYRLAHSRGQIKDMKRFAREIAESVISNFPSAPHMYALEQLMTDGALQAELWRDVLTIIDELEAKNGRSTEVGGDSTGREDQQRDSRQELSATDDQPSWG